MGQTILTKCSHCGSTNTREAEIDGKPTMFCLACYQDSPVAVSAPRTAVPKPKTTIDAAEAKSERTRLEDELAQQLALLGVPEPVREFRPISNRKWRVDFAWQLVKFQHDQIWLAVEVEGGVWKKGKDGQVGGRHNRGQGFIDDCRKYRALALAGWTVLRYTSEDIMPKIGECFGAAATEIAEWLHPVVAK